jgi:hypothetical protein
MSAQRKKNIAKKPTKCLWLLAVGYVKTIQINLGGMKAAEVRGDCVKATVQQRPGLYFPIRRLSGTAGKKKTSI